MKKVLVTPLDWGLGHATRCIPIIRALQERQCEVSLGGSGDSLELLKKEFPELATYQLPGYRPVYPSTGGMLWKMMLQLPKFRSVIKNEHRVMEQLVRQHKFDLIISDNRYGCWSDSIPSVFMTHQTNILLPKRLGWMRNWVKRMHARLINRFTTCWIPDYPGTLSLAGKLSRAGKHGPKNLHYVGNLSRFQVSGRTENKYDVVCIFSGPEPQRSIFEKIVVDQLLKSNLKYFIVRGLSAPTTPLPATMPHADFLSTADLQTLIEQATCVLSRSGFSSVMDLAKLGKKAIFIPTPGQTEQMYLAQRLMKMKITFAMDQQHFDLQKAWERSALYTGFNFMPQRFGHLNEVLDRLLHSLEIAEGGTALNIASPTS